MRLPAPRLASSLVLALAAFILTGPGLAALPASGLVGAEIDDSRDPGAIETLREAWALTPLQGQSPSSTLWVVDGAGFSVPDTGWRLVRDGREIGQGRSFLDGSIHLPIPELNAEAYRLELSARGVAKVFTLPLPSDARSRLLLEGSRPLPSPLPCQIIFVLDATVSMNPRFPTVKRALSITMDAIEDLPGISPEFGLVLFRDVGEDYLVRPSPLSQDRSRVEAALAGAYALGGGDEAEDLGAGLEAALADPGWEAGGLRLIVAITDAPPKEAALATAMAKAQGEGVGICVIGLGPLDPAAEFLLRDLAAQTGAPYIAADLGATVAPRQAQGRSQGVVRGGVETMLARLVGANVALATGRGGAKRDPALDLLDGVQARMAAALAYPEAARLRGISGSVSLALKVDAQGKLALARLAATSGSAILDKAALDLATGAFPQPNPAGAEVELEIRVVYKLGK